MDHPNAIYFLLFSGAYLVMLSAALLLGSINMGPFKSSELVPNWFKAAIGAPGLVLGVIQLGSHLRKFLGA
jgi:hypothetical protein